MANRSNYPCKECEKQIEYLYNLLKKRDKQIDTLKDRVKELEARDSWSNETHCY